MGTRLVLPDPGVRVTVTTQRPGTPRLTLRGEFVSAGKITTEYGPSHREYIQIRRQIGFTDRGAPIYRYQQIPACNVQRVVSH